MEVFATSAIRPDDRRGVWVPAFAGTTSNMPTRSAETLRLALGVEHCGAHGFAGRLARPDHELESRKIAFAGVKRADQHGFALRGGSAHSARQHQRLAVHDHAGMGPDVEVTNP